MKTIPGFLLGSMLMVADFGMAQAPAKPASTTHTGCVTVTADDANSFVLAEGDSCSLLSGKLASRQLAGHVIVLRGVFADATTNDPQTIVIERVDSVGPACSQTCTLEPPGHRGLRKKPKTGTNGGTPGV